MLSDIVGQSYAVQVLRNTLADGHVTGSFLFVGPPRVGKFTAALQFAKAMLCDRRGEFHDADCCDACASCRAADAGRHPDLRSVRPAGPSHILRIPQIWPRDGVKEFPPESALLHDLQYAPVRGPRRVFVLDEADALNDDTANSLLKVLEEPPDYATFVLTAPGASAVLPTIFSRCQTVRFQSVPQGELEALLAARGLADAVAARYIAASAQGSIGAALALAGDHDLRTARGTVLNVAEALSSTRNPLYALKLADDLRKAGAKLGGGRKEKEKEKEADAPEQQGARQAASMALELLALWYRDLLLLRSGAAPESAINSDHAAALAALAPRYEPPVLERALELILSVRDAVERNANAQIAFEALATRLATLERRPEKQK